MQVSVFVRKGWTLFAEQSRSERTNFHCTTQKIQLPSDSTHPNNTSSLALRATMISRNLKNTLVVSVGFLFLFTASGGLQNLQVGRLVQGKARSRRDVAPLPSVGFSGTVHNVTIKYSHYDLRQMQLFFQVHTMIVLLLYCIVSQHLSLCLLSARVSCGC